MQRVTVNDCHPCGVHPLPCSRRGGQGGRGGDSTGIQPENGAGTASVTSSRQATASEERVVRFGSFQKSQMKQGPQPAPPPPHQRDEGRLYHTYQPIKTYLVINLPNMATAEMQLPG